MEIDWGKVNTSTPYADDWAGLSWSKWHDLADIHTRTRPYLSGVYRLRHPDYDGLVYIGETGQQKGLAGRRLPALAANVYSDRQTLELNPDAEGVPHTAAPSLVRLCDRAPTNRLEVSYATPQVAEQGKWMRRGLEAGLIAIHRRAAGRSPWAFERRPEHDIWDAHAEPLSWNHWKRPQAQNWMGVDWVSPYPMSELDEVPLPGQGVYKIWDANTERVLRYIGEGDIYSRLSKHRSIDGEDAMFSVASLSAPRNTHNEKHRRDIEVELLGAHFLAIGKPPLRQFNHTPNRSEGDGTTQSRLF